MALDPSFVGRERTLPDPYQVSTGKIREFAAAIGDVNPLYVDDAAARRAGYPSVIAPPTFAIAVVAGAQDAVLFDPDLGLDFERVVHRDQQFVHHRPMHAGDTLTCTVLVQDIRVLAGNDVLTVRTDIVDPEGKPVCTAIGTVVARGPDR